MAAEIDDNLRRLRERTTAEEIEQQLQLETNHPAIHDTRDERANRVLELALRGIDMHGWEAEVTDDSTRLRLSGGSVSVDLGLSASILRFIEKQG